MQEKPALQFIITENSFIIDETGFDSESKPAASFIANRYDALFQLGFSERTETCSPSFEFLYLLSSLFIAALTDRPDLEMIRSSVAVLPDDGTYERLLAARPFCPGSEYITRTWVKTQFEQLSVVFSKEITAFSGTAAEYLSEKNKQLRIPERIFFHLVQNNDDQFRFAFLATYAAKGADGTVCHFPLSHALTEYHNDREKLLFLLSCLEKAASCSSLVASFMKSGELFHPLKLSADEAYVFLKAIPEIEKTGILCRVPDWWKRKQSSISLHITLGDKKKSFTGFDSIVSLYPSFNADGVELSQDEVERLLEEAEGLRLIKGKWIEVDHEHLKKILKAFNETSGDITLLDALKMEAGIKTEMLPADDGVVITNGEWLSDLLRKVRIPASLPVFSVPETFCGTLRGYQQTGASWLSYMGTLGFGACLADDMGLGKTVQVLACLEKIRYEKNDVHILLVVPASLLGNWEKEILRFTPSLPYHMVHGKKKSETIFAEESVPFLTVTTYGMVTRLEEIAGRKWDCVILDEAQAIKNPGTKQTHAVKKITAPVRIAMTGTPVENDLTNLWSLFDFLDKGLLGSSKEFASYVKRLAGNPEGYGKLRTLVSPFILRRLKSDKTIISDLPEKLETVDYVPLSKKQTVLYRRQIDMLEEAVKKTAGIQRKGLVLATLTKLKQICNHPDQFLGQNEYAPEDSGKFDMLRSVCETIYEKRERVLVFTQFREITEPLAKFLTSVFHEDGLVLHGGVPAKKRTALVEQFNGERYVPFMVLSLKAGGTGLNLTKANHVIHFDRWWNPAVENQATDRAYRIGQNRNVLVHKFVCSGTIEEKIDEMITSKNQLAENILQSGESWITGLSDAELVDLLTLK
jgi:hypothetical protein